MFILKFIKNKTIDFILFLFLVVSILCILYFIFDFVEDTNKSETENTTITNTLKYDYSGDGNFSVSSLSFKYDLLLDIPSIDFKRGLYLFDSEFNNVDENLELIEGSSLPNNDDGITIIAGHTGSGDNAYFNNLSSLFIGATAKLFYDGIWYQYILENVIEIDKNGYFLINENYRPNTLLLITCKSNSDKQEVYVFNKY